MAGSPQNIKRRNKKVFLHTNSLNAHSAIIHTGEIDFYYLFDKDGIQIGGALIGHISDKLIKL